MWKRGKIAGFFRSGSAFMNLLVGMLKMVADYYPGQLHSAFVIDPPSLFSYLWKVLLFIIIIYWIYIFNYHKVILQIYSLHSIYVYVSPLYLKYFVFCFFLRLDSPMSTLLFKNQIYAPSFFFLLLVSFFFFILRKLWTILGINCYTFTLFVLSPYTIKTTI